MQYCKINDDSLITGCTSFFFYNYIIFEVKCRYSSSAFSRHGLHAFLTNTVNNLLNRATFWFEVTFLSKILGILITRGEKDNSITTHYSVNSSLRELRLMSHQSDYSILNIYVITKTVITFFLDLSFSFAFSLIFRTDSQICCKSQFSSSKMSSFPKQLKHSTR